MPSDLTEVIKLIDHTLLKAAATPQEVRELCESALAAEEVAGVLPAAVCVNGSDVSICADVLRGTDIKVCAVVGFPLGKCTTSVKAFETEECLKHGASEIDMVINLGELLSGAADSVRAEIAELAQITGSSGALLKVIIESGTLDSKELIQQASELAVEARADYVKTSTGFSGAGAQIKHVQIMRAAVGDALGVKASGGIRSADDALAMIGAGADRIGASAGLLASILEQLRAE